MKHCFIFFFFALSLFLISAPKLDAQTKEYPKNSIDINWGYAPLTDLLDAFVAIFNSGIIEDNSTIQYGSYTASYTHRLTKMIGVGGAFTYSGSKASLLYDDDVHGSRLSNYYSLLGSATFYWVNADWFTFYSKVGLGVLLFDMSDTKDGEGITNRNTDLILSFQASLLGLEFGRKVAFFLELGTGNQGFGMAGLRYKF